MATDRLRTLVTHLQKLVVPFDDETTDRELLRRFSAERDETAFTEVVRRHGPMLSRLCRRILHDGHDAEDICQAAFLLLAQKGSSVRWHASVAGWLFQTAYRLSLQARTTANRRAHHEAQARPVRPSEPVAEVSVRELQTILDDELSRLPDKYRVPILLCCLKGKSRDEAARHLGWKLATVKDRLEQGRERLRVRLARRGLLLGTGLMSAWLLEGGARAEWSSGAVRAIARAAVSIVAGQATPAGLLPARVAALAEGGTPMFLNRMTIVAILGVVLGLGAAGVATWLSAGTSPVQAAQTPSAQPAKAEAALTQPAALLLAGHKGAVRAVAFAPDGKSVATAGADGTVRIWDSATGKESHNLKLELPGEAIHVAFAPDGRMVAAAFAGGKAGGLIAWDAATGKQLWIHGEGPDPGVFAVAFAPDGRQVMAGMEEWPTWVIDAPTGRMLSPRTTGLRVARPPGVKPGAVSPDGKLQAVGGDTVINLIDRATFGSVHRWTSTGGVSALTFLPGGTKLAVADGGQAVRILDVKNGQEEPAFACREGVQAVALSSDGKRVATAGKGGEVRLWDAATGKVERLFFTPKGPVHTVAFSPDGRRLATVDKDGTVIVWDLTQDEKPLPWDLKLTEKELNALWEALASEQGLKAYAAQRMLRADPVRSVPFLQERLKPRDSGADDQKVRQLIADLDSDDFATREKAANELEKHSKAAESVLRQALAAEPSLEVKRRLERLLEPLGGNKALTPEQWRDVRAVRVLEQAGTPEAKKLLEGMMEESPGWWATQEARAALERLAQRDKKP